MMFLVPVFTSSFDKISMLLLYCFSTGVHHHFHASIVPSVEVFLFHTLFTSSRKPVIFVFFFLVVKLIVGCVSPLKASRVGLFLVAPPAGDSRGCTQILIPVFSDSKCKGKRMEELLSCFPSPLVSFPSSDPFFSLLF